MSKIGIIDIGSNTFNLLISCVTTKKSIFRCEDFVGIRKGTIDGFIQEKTIVNSIKLINKYKNKCKKLDCKKIYLVATASLREPKNNLEFLDRCKKKTGLIINIISGIEEAKLIFHGISNNIHNLNNYLIVDIGGASTEFVICKYKKAIYKKSFSFGSQLLLQKFKPTSPINSQDLFKINSFFKKKLKNLLLVVKKYKIINLIGSSGSINCLANIQSLNAKAEKLDYLNIEQFTQITSPKILNSTIEDRKKIPGLVKMRAENIIITIILINFLIDEGIKNVYTSKFSLNDGIFSNILNNTISWQESLL